MSSRRRRQKALIYGIYSLADLLPGAKVSDGNKGDITVSVGGTVWTINANTITNAKMAQMASLTIKGNNTSATADPIDLTVPQVDAMLSGIALARFNGQEMQ